MTGSDRLESLEIVITPEAGFADAGGAPLVNAKESFEALGRVLRDSVISLGHSLKTASNAPDEVEIRLDLKLKGEAKWVVVSTGAEATTGVKLVWKAH